MWDKAGNFAAIVAAACFALLCSRLSRQQGEVSGAVPDRLTFKLLPGIAQISSSGGHEELEGLGDFF